MERLTKRRIRGNGYVSAIGSGVGCWGKIIDRLAAYENTGLTPEEIAVLRKREQGLAELLVNISCGCTVTYSRLAELARAEKDGRLIVEPPNEPLTLEELREMDGEPIWVVPLVPDSGDDEDDDCMEPRWSVFHAFHPESNFDGYGDRWLAYRRKPEARPQEGC